MNLWHSEWSLCGLGRQTHRHSADGPHFSAATGWLVGEIGGPAGSKTPQVSGIGRRRTYTTRAHSQSLVLMTKVRNFTLDLSGCRTGGEEDGGRWEGKEGRKRREEQEQLKWGRFLHAKASWQWSKVGHAELFSGLMTVWLIDILAKAQLAPQRWQQTLKTGGAVTLVSDIPLGIQVGRKFCTSFSGWLTDNFNTTFFSSEWLLLLDFTVVLWRWVSPVSKLAERFKKSTKRNCLKSIAESNG